MSLRIIFMGTPEFSVPTLSALDATGHDVIAVYSQPPRPSGRGMGKKKSPVHMCADELGIPVFTPTTLKTDQEFEILNSHNADIAVVVAYGLILPQAILDVPKLGCYNGHASLLPRWRGAAPIQRAIEAGDQESGVMIMKMEAGLDTGPVLMSKIVEIPPDMNAGELHDILAKWTGNLMVGALDLLDSGKYTLVPQPEEGITYARKIEKSESRINWACPASEVHNHIRAMSPFPGAWCEMGLGGKPTRVKILQAEPVDGKGKPGEIIDSNLTIGCEDGAVRLLRLQRSGKQPCDAAEFLRGNSISIGDVLS